MGSKKQFSWSGSCQIQCQGGKCETFCSSGVVWATNIGDAKLQAAADLKLAAQLQGGTIVHGTVSIKIGW
jgi:hypothetical protein